MLFGCRPNGSNCSIFDRTQLFCNQCHFSRTFSVVWFWCILILSARQLENQHMAKKEKKYLFGVCITSKHHYFCMSRWLLIAFDRHTEMSWQYEILSKCFVIFKQFNGICDTSVCQAFKNDVHFFIRPIRKWCNLKPIHKKELIDTRMQASKHHNHVHAYLWGIIGNLLSKSMLFIICVFGWWKKEIL